MLSILLPVHNWPVAATIQSLWEQVNHFSLLFEIICCDNGSKPDLAREQQQMLAHLPHVRYIIKPEALSRSAVRNLLVRQAKYNKLLFIDGDAGKPPNDYIAKYLEHYEKPVVAGGIGYEPKAPADKKQYLRWFYGQQREMLPLSERLKNPYNVLTFFNLMLDKQLLTDHPLDERLTQYGHEDTLFVMTLKKKGIPVLPINNRLVHKGLEDGETFLEKSKTAAQSLALLCNKHPELRQIKLAKTAFNLKKAYLDTLFVKSFELILPHCQKKLLSTRPSLKCLDAYKLWAFLC